MEIIYDRNVKMLRYTVTPEDMEEVNRKYAQLFSQRDILNANTVYERKESRIAGILGEVVFKKLYPEAKKAEDITYDFDWKDYKLDVKCKYRTVPPTLDYQASFFSYQSDGKFHADLYYFMSTIPSYKYVWLCGVGTKDYILNSPHMELWRAGEIDKRNGMEFRKDTVCIKYKYLTAPDIEKIYKEDNG